jgi:GTP-binding protein
VRSAAFVAGAARADQLPPPGAPEVAFAGRSNVGKSSLLQSLVGRRGLVRISNTPGRTRQINLFDVELADLGSLSFADLPGYGFAKVSKSERKGWGTLMERYLETRESLRVVVVIVDARRGAEPDDGQLADYLRSIDRPLIVAVTKTDKLAKNAVKPRVAELGKALGSSAVAYSSVTGAGRPELWRLLLRTCGLVSGHSGDDRDPRPSA